MLSASLPARPLLLAAVLVSVLALLVALAWNGASPTAAQDGETDVPTRPTGLTHNAEPGSLEVSLDWYDTPGATQYRVRWRSPGPGQKLNEGITTTSSDAVITFADYGEWLVRLDACNDAGCGPAATWKVILMPGRARTWQSAQRKGSWTSQRAGTRPREPRLIRSVGG